MNVGTTTAPGHRPNLIHPTQPTINLFHPRTQIPERANYSQQSQPRLDQFPFQSRNRLAHPQPRPRPRTRTRLSHSPPPHRARTNNPSPTHLPTAPDPQVTASQRNHQRSARASARSTRPGTTALKTSRARPSPGAGPEGSQPRARPAPDRAGIRLVRQPLTPT